MSASAVAHQRDQELLLHREPRREYVTRPTVCARNSSTVISAWPTRPAASFTPTIRTRHLHGGHNCTATWSTRSSRSFSKLGELLLRGPRPGSVPKDDAVMVPGHTLYELREYSEDLELLEFTARAIYETIRN